LVEDTTMPPISFQNETSKKLRRLLNTIPMHWKIRFDT